MCKPVRRSRGRQAGRGLRCCSRRLMIARRGRTCTPHGDSHTPKKSKPGGRSPRRVVRPRGMSVHMWLFGGGCHWGLIVVCPSACRCPGCLCEIRACSSPGCLRQVVCRYISGQAQSICGGSGWRGTQVFCARAPRTTLGRSNDTSRKVAPMGPCGYSRRWGHISKTTESSLLPSFGPSFAHAVPLLL